MAAVRARVNQGVIHHLYRFCARPISTNPKKGGGCIGSNVDLGIGRIPHLSLHPSECLDAGLC
jgi:hypothetical protein